MQVKTWLQRLTDENSMWFNAIKAEDEGHFDDAASNYLNDALGCIKQRSLVRAALSCSCAANCLSRMGALSLARTLYSEAANIYVENSEVAMSYSIREALWSLQEAFENYVLADNMVKANVIREGYLKLAARTSAYFTVGGLEKDLESRKATATETMSKIRIASVKKQQETIPDKLAKEIEKLMKARVSSIGADVFNPVSVEKSINQSIQKELAG